MPKPPGRTAYPSDSLRSISLRVKKYFISTSLGSPEMKALGASSNGNRMLIPKALSGPAPSKPAAMIPGPAPVTSIHPARARLAASSLAWA